MRIDTRKEFEIAEKVKGEVQPDSTLDIIKRNLDVEVVSFDFFDAVCENKSSFILHGRVSSRRMGETYSVGV